jgi:hypothetical protein
MKKLTISIFATGVFVALAGSGMAQTIANPAGPNAALVDPINATDVAPDPALSPDTQAAAQPKLKFKIKGVQTDDEGGAEGHEGGESHDGHGGDSQHESENDNG